MVSRFQRIGPSPHMPTPGLSAEEAEVLTELCYWDLRASEHNFPPQFFLMQEGEKYKIQSPTFELFDSDDRGMTEYTSVDISEMGTEAFTTLVVSDFVRVLGRRADGWLKAQVSPLAHIYLDRHFEWPPVGIYNPAIKYRFIHGVFRVRPEKLDPLLCFVVMPFDKAFDPVWRDAIAPACRSAGLRPLRADEMLGTSAVMTDVWKSILAARVIIADLSGKNANVFYEVGLAHAEEKDVVLLYRKSDEVPFDLKHLRRVKYDGDPANFPELQERLVDEVCFSLANSKTSLALRESEWSDENL